VLTRDEVLEWRISRCCLVPVLNSPKQLSGLEVDQEHWEQIRDAGEQCYLLVPCCERSANSHAALRRYLNRGRRAGVPKAFKCRSRPSWFKVRLTDPPDAFLSYMNYGAPRLVVNSARLSATNRLHHLYFNVPAAQDVLKRFALAFLNPLTLATAEIASRVYGGGVLKIEPGDCAHIWVPDVRDERLKGFDRVALTEIDALLRLGEDWEAIDRTSGLLAETLSIPAQTMQTARRVYRELRTRRTGDRDAR